ncbi:hypothetical protein [Terrabacter sp. NPDC000476]|uniref:hypothetical protein n=1 Tax=Terrabacter sp. NPDC000476 TaxID=3154258 RepID=UPI0033188AE2
MDEADDLGGGRRAWLAARPYVVVLTVSSLVVSRWFRTGTFVATGDMGAWIRRGWTPEVLDAWNHQTTGAGSAGYTMARWAEFIVLWVVRHLGGDEYAGQWLFYTFIYGLVGFGVAYCARAVVDHEVAVVVAGSFGVLNGFFLTRLPNPLNIISVGSVALLTGVVLRVAQGRRIPLPLAGVALWPTSFLAFNPPMLVVAYAWALGGTVVLTLLVLGWRAAGRAVGWLVGAAPWALLLNVWWLVPLASSYTGGGGAQANADFTDPTNWTWAQINNVPQNVLTMVANWAWFRPQYLPFAADLDQPWLVWVRYLLPALVFLAPVLARPVRRRLSLVLMGLVVVFVSLAKGLMPPFSGVNLWLYLHVPGFWLFREPMSKLGQLLVLFFALQLAIVVEGVFDRAVRGAREVAARREGAARRRSWRTADRWLVGAVGAAVVGVLAYPFPLWTGSVVPDERPTQPSAHVRVPDYWWQLATAVDADPRPGKVLVLPLDDYYQMPTTWGFFGVDSIANLLFEHPVVQRKPDGYFGDVPGLNADVQAIETALVTGDLAPVPRLLDAVGVSRVIVRHDLVRGLPGRHFADDRVITAAMLRVPGLTRTRSGTLDLWQVGDGSSPTVRTFDRVLDAPARPTAVAAALAGVDTRTALAAAPLPEAAPGVAVDTSVAATNDVVEWPVPASDTGSATSTFTLRTAGTFTLAQRARAAAVLRPVVTPAGVELRDPTAVAVDGTVVSRRPTTTVAVPAGRAPVAVVANGRTVALDGWGRGSLPTTQVAVPPSITVGAATAVTVLAPVRQAARVSPLSAVYDCNNYEPRPTSELGMRRDLLGSGAARVVRLTARDHAACTRLDVTGVHAGQVVRVRLSYRQLSGKRPQVCVWQVGVDGCADAPRSRLGRSWSTFETFVHVAPGVTRLQVVLHADVGQRIVEPTVTDYRGMTVDLLEPAVSTTVWPAVPDAPRLHLSAGSHRITVTGGPGGSVLAGFEPLQDCFRTDDLTPAQAGLMMQTEGTGVATTYTMGARSHMACLGSTVPDMGSSSLYVLSLEARSVALRDPKFCVYDRGPDQCQSLPTQVGWNTWTAYSAAVSPNPLAIESRVYLYGRRDLAEKNQAQVAYRDVALRPVVSPSTIVLVRESSAATPTPVEQSWSRQRSTHFPVSVDTRGGTVVALAETYAPGWTAPGLSATRHRALQGWMNAWTVPAGVRNGSLAYAPARLATYALYALPFGLALGAVWVAVGVWWRRRRAARTRRVAS